MNHDHLKQHLPFIVEMIESVKTVEFRHKWQIMKELIESNKLTVKQIETIEINIKKAKELKEQYKKTIVYTSLPNIDKSNVIETTKTENHAVETGPKTENTAIKAEINDLKVKKQMKELRRLHENIVKDEIPLPSKRRSALKRSYRDSLEMLLDKSDDFLNLKKKKSESDNEKKTTKDDSIVTQEDAKRSSIITRKSLEAPKNTKVATENRRSLGNARKIKNTSKLAENDVKIAEASEQIETSVPITKTVAKIANKSLELNEVKSKSIEISKPSPEKRQIKEVAEHVKQKRKSVNIKKPVLAKAPTIIEEKIIILKPKKPIELVEHKSVGAAKSAPLIIEAKKTKSY
ncbi:synaptonemal complex protein 1-like [Chironomus tepperi]|uniref:synaptonemal complex protein 1-like n=1 Tax=Chironomus tepperi TaxID=113505 RepID=UPI00391F04F5